MQSNKQIKVDQKTLDSYRTLEAGDIALFNFNKVGIFILGNTGTGKTTAGHIMTGSTVRARKVNHELVLEPSTQRFSAKVGNGVDSETQIPNIFQTVVINPKTRERCKTIIVDQPGYEDTYGFHRIFTNGYFHYRSFSKTSKIKFVLTFSQSELQANASKFKRTIFRFISAFNRYPQIKEKILAATSFLITKTQRSAQALKDKLKVLCNATNNMGANQRDNFQSLITHVVENNKVYLIEKPTKEGGFNTQTNILQNIYSNSEFWERPKIQNSNYVQMHYINFSVADQVLSNLRSQENELFREDFSNFMSYTQYRVNNIISAHEGSLQNIVRQLIQDATASNQSNKFLQLMQHLNSKYYKFSPSYDIKRRQREIDLFRQEETEIAQSNIRPSSSIRAQSSKERYFLNKFKVLQELENIFQQKIKPQNRMQPQRTIQQLQKTSTIFRRLFQKFSILGASRQQKHQIIYKYSYIIQRLIEEYKIITLIFFNDRSVVDTLVRLEIDTFSEDLTRSIADKFFFSTLGEIKVKKLKMLYAKKFTNFDDVKSLNEDIIQFFQGIISHEENPKSYQTQYKGNSTKLQSFNQKAQNAAEATMEESLDQQTSKEDEIFIMLKVSSLLKRYYQLFFQTQAQPSSKDQRIWILKKLYLYRYKLYDQLVAEEANNRLYTQQVFKQVKSQVFCLTQLMAKVLFSLNRFQQSKDCYISINDANSVFQIFEIQCKLATIKSQLRKLMLEYGKAATLYDRKELAKLCFQKAYSFSKDCDETDEVTLKLIDLYDEELKSCCYIDKLRKKRYCQELSECVNIYCQKI